MSSLPPNWIAYTDPATGHVFYSNSKTGDVQWEMPTNEAECGDDLQGKLCKACGKPLDGAVIMALDAHWHEKWHVGFCYTRASRYS